MKFCPLVRIAAVFVITSAIACDKDTDIDEPRVPLPEAIVYGLVRDNANEIPVQFTVLFETTASSTCDGPAIASTAAQFSGTFGAYRLIVLLVPNAVCHRLVVTSQIPSGATDTVRNVQPKFDAPDSLRVDVVVKRSDVQIVRRRAVLGSAYNVPIVVTVPDTVDRNQPFTVSSSHHGSTSCTTLDTVEVAYGGQTAVLSPYVFEHTGGACTADLRRFTQSAQVTFVNPGPATIQVIGRDTTVTRTTFVR